MNPMVLLALRRKLAMYERAGMSYMAERTRTQIALCEAAPEPDSSEQDGTIEQPVEIETLAPAGVELTPAARERAEELGLTLDDFVGHEPSGKGGQFLLGDVERIASSSSES